jgi:two-component system, LuxR family, response regulator FixJ
MEFRQTIHTVLLERPALSLVESVARDRGLGLESHASVEAVLRAPRAEAGVIVLDVGAGGEDEILQTLERLANLPPVIVLAESPRVRSAVRWMQAGAASVLEKPVGREELEPELEAALRRDAHEREAQQQAEELRARFAALTDGEQQVLEQLVTGLANKNIAADLQIGLRTVELRRSKILKKTGAGSLAELVRLAMIAHPGWLHHPPRQ